MQRAHAIMFYVQEAPTMASMAVPCQGGLLLSGLDGLKARRVQPGHGQARRVAQKYGGGLMCRATGSSSSTENRPPGMPYSVITGLAAAGLAESSFLAWTKVAQGAVACPLGGPGCDQVLNGDFDAVYGIPISMLGVGFYGAASLMGLLRKPEQRTLLLGCTTAMAAASAYLIYIVVAKFQGASCTYCAASAMFSLGLLLASMRGMDSREDGQTVPMQLAVAASVVLALHFGFGEAEASAMITSAGAQSASALESILH